MHVCDASCEISIQDSTLGRGVRPSLEKKREILKSVILVWSRQVSSKIELCELSFVLWNSILPLCVRNERSAMSMYTLYNAQATRE
jgi:hypothetical protein